MARTEALKAEIPKVDDTGSPPASPGVPATGGNGLTRMTVNLNRQAVNALEQVSAATGYSKTDTVNRALQIYAIVQSIMERNNGVLRVAHTDGEVEAIYLV
jgi:hypothetical protein